MKRVKILLIILIFIIFSGCTNSFNGVVYGEDDKHISTEAGKTFSIGLKRNPITGYDWNVNISDDILRLDSDEYVQDSKDTHIVGSGGLRVFTFQALEKGKTTIVMNYERSFEENSTIETLVFEVTVD